MIDLVSYNENARALEALHGVRVEMEIEMASN